MALLVLLLFSHLILDINSQNYPQPWLSVSREVLTVRGSVQLLCEVPHHVKASQCIFYPKGRETKTELSPSCQLSITGLELIRWTGHSSPGTIQMICFYTVAQSGQTPSPHSLAAPVTVLNPKLTVSYDDQMNEFTFVCEIPESESLTDEFYCNLYTGENPQPYLKVFYSKRKSGKAVCLFKAERNEVFIRLQSVNKYEVRCDYSLNPDSTTRSLMSDKYTLTRFFTTQPPIPAETNTARPLELFPETSQPPTTKESTTDLRPVTTSPPGPTGLCIPPSTTVSAVLLSISSISSRLIIPNTHTDFNRNATTGEKSKLQILLLSVLTVCVSLAGTISFSVCCVIKWQKAKRRKVGVTHGHQGVKMSMLDLNLSAGGYTVISTVPLPSTLLDPSRDRKEDSKTEDDVYHMYCSISDPQPVVRDTSVYSLAHAH